MQLIAPIVTKILIPTILQLCIAARSWTECARELGISDSMMQRVNILIIVGSQGRKGLERSFM